MQKWAIIVAGGKGLRMGSDIPKQFLEIDGKPIIVHTIERFLNYDSKIQVIIVTPADQSELWDDIQSKYLQDENIRRVDGGATRCESVRNGLDAIANEGLVSIHDAVRPFVSNEIIEASFQSAYAYGSGVAAVELKDSIRELRKKGSLARDRSQYRLVQTPQTFRVSEIMASFSKINRYDYSDDATVYEAAGYHVRLVNGSYENIKITTPEDLK